MKPDIRKYVTIVEGYANGRFTLESVERRLHRLGKTVDLSEQDAFVVGLIEDFVGEVESATAELDWSESGDDGHLRFEAARVVDELRDLSGL